MTEKARLTANGIVAELRKVLNTKDDQEIVPKVTKMVKGRSSTRKPDATGAGDAGAGAGAGDEGAGAGGGEGES